MGQCGQYVMINVKTVKNLRMGGEPLYDFVMYVAKELGHKITPEEAKAMIEEYTLLNSKL